jgi:ribosomal protein L40E
MADMQYRGIFCTTCGSENPNDAKFCRECWSRLARTKAELLQRTDREVLLEILRTDQKPNECHRCGAESELTRHDFAIAKVVSVQREWGETIARTALSVISLATAPLTGFSAFSWKVPNKTTSFNLFKAKLVLCRTCLSWAWRSNGRDLKKDAYICHPWSEKALRIGYDKYLSAEEILRLIPIE